MAGEIDARAWMAGLTGDLALSDVTLPGAHDACALHGGPWPQTQTRSLTEQLNAGVRFLDIRCRQERDVFRIFHGPVDQHLEFGEGVLEVCLGFLAAHPSETIVMSVKTEWIADGNERTFEQVFRDYLARCEDRWRLADTVPTLAEARGRIVLFRRFETDAPDTVLGLNPLPWPDNTIFETSNAASFRIQDAWRAPTVADRRRKWRRVKALLDRANAGAPKLCVNFCSATGAESPPHVMAAYINPRLTSYLTANPKGRFGWLFVDFETDALNRLIFETNFYLGAR